MGHEWLVERLAEAIATEEVDVLNNLNEVEEAVLSSGFDDLAKDGLLAGVRRLREDSIRHTKAFAGMLTAVVKG